MKLKPCPFCGGSADIILCDNEGNLREAGYLDNPYSGITYGIAHLHEDNNECPIARYKNDGGEMGVYLYDSKQEAIKAWNRRAKNG